MPSIATLIYIGITVINQYPHIFNYPVAITEENTLKQYTLATQLLRIMKLVIVFVFGWITLQDIYFQSVGLGIWFLPLILILTFSPIIYFILKINKSK